MQIGYARTSTLDQLAGLDAQVRDLEAAGCDRIFREQVSSVDVVKREQLDAALDYLRDGDTLIVTKLDRLARSVAHLLQIVAKIEEKGAFLRIISMSIDTSTPTGKLMLTMLGAVGQFERDIMLERQLEGIAKAKAEGKYKGRAPTARAKADEVRRLLADGHSKVDVADRLGISRSSVHRIVGTG
jgi:DNA invertase Pin-like site-specific DNA recombinase